MQHALTIPDDWQPTPENVNALPAPLRRYIHDIETVCDHSGIVRENFMLRVKLETCVRGAIGWLEGEGLYEQADTLKRALDNS